MRIEGLDHVNIVAADLAATVAFYQTVLGMTCRDNPALPAGFPGAWLCDASGRAVIHVQAWSPERHPALESRSHSAVDHVALACTDFDGMLLRCAELGVETRVNDRKYGNVRQVFVTDPDGVTLELNFSGD